MLSHRPRRWTNIKPTLIQCLVFAGMAASLRSDPVSHPRWCFVIGSDDFSVPAASTLSNAVSDSSFSTLLDQRLVLYDADGHQQQVRLSTPVSVYSIST